MYNEQEVIDTVRHALSPANYYFCSQKLGREPSVMEALEHYLRFASPPIHIVEYVVEDDEQLPLFI